jgi:hypothetical protein
MKLSIGHDHIADNNVVTKLNSIMVTRFKGPEPKITQGDAAHRGETAAGRSGEMLARLFELTGEHPYRERFTLQLTAALYHAGQQGRGGRCVPQREGPAAREPRQRTGRRAGAGDPHR